jgi:hypothetical protein
MVRKRVVQLIRALLRAIKRDGREKRGGQIKRSCWSRQEGWHPIVGAVDPFPRPVQVLKLQTARVWCQPLLCLGSQRMPSVGTLFPIRLVASIGDVRSRFRGPAHLSLSASSLLYRTPPELLPTSPGRAVDVLANKKPVPEMLSRSLTKRGFKSPLDLDAAVLLTPRSCNGFNKYRATRTYMARSTLSTSCRRLLPLSPDDLSSRNRAG